MKYFKIKASRLIISPKPYKDLIGLSAGVFVAVFLLCLVFPEFFDMNLLDRFFDLTVIGALLTFVLTIGLLFLEDAKKAELYRRTIFTYILRVPFFLLSVLVIIVCAILWKSTVKPDFMINLLLSFSITGYIIILFITCNIFLWANSKNNLRNRLITNTITVDEEILGHYLLPNARVDKAEEDYYASDSETINQHLFSVLLSDLENKTKDTKVIKHLNFFVLKMENNSIFGESVDKKEIDTLFKWLISDSENQSDFSYLLRLFELILNRFNLFHRKDLLPRYAIQVQNFKNERNSTFMVGIENRYFSKYFSSVSTPEEPEVVLSDAWKITKDKLENDIGKYLSISAAHHVYSFLNQQFRESLQDKDLKFDTQISYVLHFFFPNANYKILGKLYWILFSISENFGEVDSLFWVKNTRFGSSLTGELTGISKEEDNEAYYIFARLFGKDLSKSSNNNLFNLDQTIKSIQNYKVSDIPYNLKNVASIRKPDEANEYMEHDRIDYLEYLEKLKKEIDKQTREAEK
jgi:hypothetical protein